MHEKLKRAKHVIKNNWKPFTVGVVFTGVTFIVTKRFTMRYLPVEGSQIIIHKTIVKDGGLYKVFNIYGAGFKHHGRSWMVRCKETGKIFRSQEHAAKVMGLSETHLSQHLNDVRHNVGGYHFERIGMNV